MMDDNSKLEYSAEISLVRALSAYKIPTRVVCQGSFTASTGRQIMKSFSILDDKYYIYFQGRYVPNPNKPGMKMSIFSSTVLVDWSSGSPVELIHQHIEHLSDIQTFITSVLDLVKGVK